jgi:hypothetical protein
VLSKLINFHSSRAMQFFCLIARCVITYRSIGAIHDDRSAGCSALSERKSRIQEIPLETALGMRNHAIGNGQMVCGSAISNTERRLGRPC